jgi:hypothetical protein
MNNWSLAKRVDQTWKPFTHPGALSLFECQQLRAARSLIIMIYLCLYHLFHDLLYLFKVSKKHNFHNDPAHKSQMVDFRGGEHQTSIIDHFADIDQW